MKTTSRVLTLTSVTVLLGLGAWLLFGAWGGPTPPAGEVADRSGEPITPPPVLQGRERDPVGEIETPAPVVPSRHGALVVRVFDDARGRALEGAEVRVTQEEGGTRSYRTNETGIVELTELRPGAVYVVARAPGFVRAETQRELAGDERGEIELRLARGVRLEGTVVEVQTGLAVAHASVVVVPGGSLDGWTEMNTASPFGGALTDERGRFVVDGVAPDVLLTVRATAEGHGAASQSMRLAPALDVPTTVVLRLPPAAALTGTVLGPDGEPAAGARVYAVPADAPDMLLADPESQCTSNGRPYTSLRGIADADGAFRIDGLELESLYIVFAALEGHGRSVMRRGVVATEEDPRPRVDLVLTGAASLTVRVWNPDGEPQDEGRVLLFGDGFPLKLELRSPGVFAVHEPPPGTYTLRVVCPGAVMDEQPVEIAAAEQVKLEVRLARGLVLAGVLVDDTGRPIANQKLFVDRHWQAAGKHAPSQGNAVTDEGGRFHIGGLRDGPHTLGLVLGRHVVPDDLRLRPPDEALRLVVLRKAGLRFRLRLPPGFTPPEKVGIRVGREEDGGYAESGHGLAWSEGELRFDDLAPGKTRVRIQVEGLLEAVREPTLKPGETVDLGTVALAAGLELEGRVVDRQDQPIEGARVNAGQVWTATHRTVVAGPDGGFVLPTLARGESEIEIRATGFLMRRVRVVMPGEADRRSFVLDRGGLVTIRVEDAEGQAAPARRVRCRPAASGDDTETTDIDETDAKGLLDVRLREGTWTLEVIDGEGEVVAATAVDVTEGGSAKVNLALPR